MRQNFEIRAITGILIWIGLIALGIMLARESFSGAPDATRMIAQYIGKQRRIVELNLPVKQYVAVGDPVYLPGVDDVAPVGVVSLVNDKSSTHKGLAWVDRVYVTLYGSAPALEDGDFMTYHYAPDSSAWVLQTMLPPEKREELTKLIVDSYRENQQAIVDALRPVVEASLRDASQVIKDDLQVAFEKREDQIRKIGQRFQKDLIEKEIVPLVQQEIWPIVRTESEPLASVIGQEIWNEVSVFGFGWRYLYDRAPLPDKKLTEKEFKRFVEQKAIPILQSHMGEFVELQQMIIKKVSENEKVKTTLSKSLKTVLNDEDVQELLRDVFQEVFLDNDRLKTVLEEHWNGPRAKYALALANQRLEPTITDIGISLFGSPREKITPEFARVVRHRILHKDSRWFTLHAANVDRDQLPLAGVGPSELPVKIAQTQAVIPYAPARDSN